MTDYEYALRTVAIASGQEFEIAHAVASGTLVALCGTVAVPQPGSRWANTDPDARCEACERLVQAERSSVPVVEKVHWPVVRRPVESVEGESAPVAEPEPTPEPETMHELTPEPTPEPEPEPEPETMHELTPEPEPEPSPARVPEPPSAATLVAEPEPEPERRRTVGDRASRGVDAVATSLRGPSRWVWLSLGAVLLVVIGITVTVLLLSSGFHADQNSPAYENGYAYGHDLMSQSHDVSGSCAQAAVDDPASTAGKNFIAGCEAGYAARTQ